MSSRITRRAIVAGGLSALAAPAVVRAQNWPSQPITFVNPFPAGGGTDVFGRHFLEALVHRVDGFRRAAKSDVTRGCGGHGLGIR